MATLRSVSRGNPPLSFIWRVERSALGPVDGVFGETNIPAEQKKTSEDARISSPDEDHRRPRGYKTPPGQGPQASRRFRLDGAPDLPTLEREGAGMDESFPPERRIRKGSEFAVVLRKGRKRKCPYFTLHILSTPSRRRARIGIIASRRVGGAVQRNRAKRLLREVFRRHGSQLPAGADLVAVARNSIAMARLEDVERAFRNAIHGKTNS